MDLDEMSDASFSEREAHYRNQVCNENSNLEERAWAYKHGHQMATAEMLNEIHVMLRELLKRSNP